MVNPKDLGEMVVISQQLSFRLHFSKCISRNKFLVDIGTFLKRKLLHYIVANFLSYIFDFYILLFSSNSSSSSPFILIKYSFSLLHLLILFQV